MNRKLILVSTLTILAGCASMEQMKQDWISAHCHRDAAYSEGMNAARNGEPMEIDPYAQMCTGPGRDSVLLGYREGYQAGVDSLRAETPHTVVNVNIGNRGGSYGSGSGRDWYCETEAFGKRFESFGPTQLEARRQAIANCSHRYAEMHCDDVQCRPNR